MGIIGLALVMIGFGLSIMFAESYVKVAGWPSNSPDAGVVNALVLSGVVVLALVMLMALLWAWKKRQEGEDSKLFITLAGLMFLALLVPVLLHQAARILPFIGPVESLRYLLSFFVVCGGLAQNLDKLFSWQRGRRSNLRVSN